MKSLLRTAITLLMCVALHSYGMSGEGDSSWLASLTRPTKRQRDEGRGQLQIALPRFKKQRSEERSEQLPLSELSSSSQVTDDEELAQRTDSQLSLNDAPEHEAGQQQRQIAQSLFELLPLELFHKHIAPLLPTKDLKHVASVSRACRTRAQFSITHLSTKLEDITKEKLEDIKCKFPNIKSLAIKGKGIKSQDIELLAQEFPDLEALDLSDTGATRETIEALSQEDVFVTLKRLNLSGNEIENVGIEVLTKASFVNQIESLNLQDTGIYEEAVVALSQPGIFTALKELNLSGNAIEPDMDMPYFGRGISGVTALAQAPFANKLVSLNLYFTGMAKKAMETLAKPDIFTALEKLNLGNNRDIGDDEVAILAQAPFAKQLKELDLSLTTVEAEGIKALAQPDKFIALKSLKFRENNIGDEGVNALVTAPFVHTLESLYLINEGITAAGVKALLTPGIFKALKVLDLSGNRIKDAGLEVLLQAPFAGWLESLNLNNTGITEAGVVALSQSTAFKSLKQLDLSWNTIGDKGIEHLVNAPFSNNLETLRLRKANLSSEAVKILFQAGVSKSLKRLDLSGNTLGIGWPGFADVGALLPASFIGQIELIDLRGTTIAQEEKRKLLLSGIAKTILF